MNQGTFGLADDTFWTTSTAIEEQLLDRFESDESFAGLILDGPREVRLDRRETLPLLAVRACTLVENATLDLDSRGILVATRLEGHETLVDFAFRQPTPPPDDDTPYRLDVDEIPEGRTVKVYALSLTERLRDFPWRPGTWQTTLLLFDQRSNPVVTRLGEAANPDPAIADFLAAQRRPGYPHAVAMPGGLPTNLYRPRLDTPPHPAGPGFTLAAPSVAVDRPGGSCMLRGSFLLPLLPRDVIRPLPGPAGSQAAQQALADGWVDAGAPDAVAVVPITVLLTGDKNPTPILLPLQAAVYGSIEGGLAKGQFAIDLFKAAPDLRAQEYAAWAMSRTIISDPVRVAVRDENP